MNRFYWELQGDWFTIFAASGGTSDVGQAVLKTHSRAIADDVVRRSTLTAKARAS